MTLIQRPQRAAADEHLSKLPLHERESLVHVLFALAASTAIACLALWTLWPQPRLGQPATGVVLAADSDSPSQRQAAVGLEQRAALAQPDISESSREPLESEVAAPEEASLHTLNGTVVDEFWHPVPFAEVWIDEGEWRLLTHADERGEFTGILERTATVDTSRSIKLGARAEHHGPSQIQSFDSLPTEFLRLVLRGQGAGLRLDVRDNMGASLAGVRISIVSSGHDPFKGSSLLGLPARLPAPPATTDQWGLLSLNGLAAGKQLLTLQKTGFSSCEKLITLREGIVAMRVVEMCATAGISGRVQRIDHGPLKGTRITVTSPNSSQEFESLTDEFGVFTLKGVPSGLVQLLARKTTPSGNPFQSQVELFLSPNESLNWNPVLHEVLSLSGRLVGGQGQSMVGWRVELRAGENESGELAITQTDEDGRYELPEPVRPAGARILFFHPFAGRGIPTRVLPLEERETSEPTTELDEEEERVSLIRGSVFHHNGECATGTIMVLYRLHDRLSVVLKIDAQGNFRTPFIPPGKYLATFPRIGLGWSQDSVWNVDGSTDMDVGMIVLPETGQLSLKTSDSNRHYEFFNMTLELLRPGIDEDFRLPVYQGTCQAPWDVALAPGEYLLNCWGDGSEIPIRFNIKSGETTLVFLPDEE